MKLNKTFFCIIFSITVISCTKKLDLKIIEDDVIKIEKYEISEITTIHEFIDITNKRWNKTERICEANQGSIDKIFLRNDSIIIKTTINALFYDLSAIKFGHKIILEK